MKRFWLMLSCAVFSVQAQKPEPIAYHLAITDAQHHLAEVTVTFPYVGTKTLDVKLPVWRSGRYEILNLSKNINHFKAADATGQAINWHKIDKNTWKLWLNRPGKVTVTYQIYANQLKARVAHIDPTHAYLDASGVFMFAPKYRDLPLTVKLEVPTGWQSRSGMESADQQHTFVADNYDQLVDSPIETGIHEFLSFKVDGKTYEIVVWGAGNHDINDLKTQVTLLHHEAKKIWDDIPFERYVYMYHAGDGLRGATEHVNSTIIQNHRFNFKPRKSYLKILATTAHEFVHTWNVKAYRPKGIAPYDYSVENYSDLFWMAEGITSYYDDLLLMRAGIYKPTEYFEKIATDIKNHLANPGRHQESLAQSSFDTWMKENSQRTHNTTVSIYLEGSLTAWRLDQEIRSLTNNKWGLDELQSRLFQKHRNIKKGYDKGDVLAILQDITGTDFSPFWQQYIEGTQAIDFKELLSFYGLHMVDKEASEDTPPKAWIGVSWTLDRDAPTVRTVDSGGPAWLAGLTAGDQLMAIDGIKVTSIDIEDRIKQLKVDEAHELHYFSAGILQTTQLKPSTEPYQEFTIEPVAKPSRQQKARFKAWAGQELLVK